MPMQTGVGLVIAYKKEASYGVLPTNDASAKQVRRESFGLSLKKDSIRSAELRKDYQRPASRHAMRKVDGGIQCELSLGTYADFIGSALRRNFAAVTSLTALTNVTATVGAPQFVRATGSWITDGLRVGMVVRCTGWTTTGVANNAKNFTIIALTATQMTVAETVAAKTAGDSVVFSIPGKVTYVPASGHTNDSYSVEQWAPDAVQSLRFLGLKVGGFSMSLQSNEKVSVTFNFMGQDRAKSTTQYFTLATAAGTSQMQTGLSGAVYYNGVPVGVLTQLTLDVSGNADTLGVVGSNITPDVFMGALDVSGSLSVAWKDGVFDDDFDLEAERPLVIKLLDSAAAAADFMTLTMPFVKLSGGDQPDAEKAIIQSFQFDARVGDGSLGYETTTLMVQDSLA